MRKTRKFPNMFGSIRKHKKDLAFAKRFDKWQQLYRCDACVSEPICINPSKLIDYGQISSSSSSSLSSSSSSLQD